MGYDVQMPPFANWMPPVADMQRPNVMFPPPQMMNNYNTPPPQQPFPFMNQPPPPLPYQMTMPPPCHQHFRMPSQTPPNVNIVSVRQEVKSVKSNPVVITQIPDGPEDEHHNIHLLEGSKCKHNPLGPNNQTVQEAIDSVKKCLKNCDALKNKDPRLALVDVRNRSPERSGSSGGCDDRKVKITLNYKPRPVSDAEQICTFEIANDESDDKSSGLVDLNKTANGNYTEKNSNIECIVSKLKDNINPGNGLTIEETEKYNSHNNLNSFENGNPGDEPYDPFNVSDEIADNNANDEGLKKKSPDKQNDTVQSVVMKDSTPKLSESEVENINDQINKSFAFILSHSIERKRLTPTLSSIVAKKAEKQKKCELNESLTSVSKTCHLNQENQRSKNNNAELPSCLVSPVIKPPHATSTEKTKPFDQLVMQEKTLVNKAACISLNSEKCKSEKLQSDKSINIPCDHVQTKSEKFLKKAINPGKQLNKKEALILSEKQKFDNQLETDHKESQLVKFGELQNKLPEEDEKGEPTNSVNSNYKTQNNSLNSSQRECTENTLAGKFSQSSCVLKNNKDEMLENQLKNGNSPSGQFLPLEKHEVSLEKERNKLCNDTTQNDDKISSKNSDCKGNEFSFGINVDLMEKQVSKQNTHGEDTTFIQTHQKTISSELKNNYNSERRGNPPLSIPTKGELKRFPTPERNIPKIKKAELDFVKESGKSKSQKNITPRQREIRGSLHENKVEEEAIKPAPSKVVESILNDFDESNSIGCDFQPLDREKPVNNDNRDINVTRGNSNPFQENVGALKQTCDGKDHNSTFESCLHTSNKISNEDQVITSCTESKFEVYQSPLSSKSRKVEKDSCVLNLVKSSQQKDQPQKYDTSDNGALLRVNDIKLSPAEKLLDGEVDRLHDESKEMNEDYANLKEDARGRLVRRSQRKARMSKSTVNNDENDELSKNDLTATKNDGPTNELPQSSSLSEDINSINQNVTPVSEMEKHENDGILKNISSTNPAVHLKSLKSNKKQFKPCPLSRKSKPYISQNLPLSFDLSVDGHLIRRGFKKLRVNLCRLSEPATAITLERTFLNVSSPCLNVASSDNDCYVDLGEESIATIFNKEEKSDKQSTTKEKPKKRVSFDLNISEIFDNSKFSSDDEVSVNTKGESEPRNGENNDGNNGNKEKIKSCDNDLPLEPTHKNPTSEKNETKEQEIKNVQILLSDVRVATVVEQVTQDEQQTNSLSSFYQGIVKTLDSLRGSPLPQLHKKKAVVVNIPTPENMPEAKVLNPLKKTSKSKTKKSVLQETLENVHESLENEEKLKNEPSKTKFVKDTLKNKDCDSSKLHESDNDESMILDRELSDLAKGCLDSDSNVGEDDDSVLNFGSAASDDSSVDSDFDFKCRNALSKIPTRQQNKLSSPQNIKKRFAKKLRSLNVDLDIKINKYMDSEMGTREENKLADSKSGDPHKNPNDVNEYSTKITGKNTLTQDIISEESSLKGHIEINEKLSDYKEIEITTSTKARVHDAHISEATLLQAVKVNETTRRTSKRQMNKSTKPLIINNETTLEENLSHSEGTTSTSKVLVKNDKQNDQNNIESDLPLNDGKNKETNVQKNMPDFNNHNSKKDTNEEKIAINNVQNYIERSETADSKEGSILKSDDLNLPIKETDGVNLNIDSKRTSQRKPRNSKTPKKTLGVKENSSVIISKLNNAVRTDTIEHKLSPTRKTRRGKLLEQDDSDQLQHDAGSEDIQPSNNKQKVNETSNIRKTRSGRVVENDLSSNNESLEDPTKSEEATPLKDLDTTCFDKEIPSNELKDTQPKKNLEVNESLIQNKTNKVSNSDPQVNYDTHIEDNISNITEDLEGKVTDDKKSDENLETNIKEDVKIETVKTNSNNECETREPTQENGKIKSNRKQKKEVKKSEDVSSTTQLTKATDCIGKTRLSQRKKATVISKSEKGMDVLLDNVLSKERSESPVRKTRSKQIVLDVIEEASPKTENDCTEHRVTLDNDISNFKTKKDELNAIKPQVVERTLSTESADEPLIFVKNKLLADKNKSKSEEQFSEYSQDNKHYEKKCIVLQNEDIKCKSKSSVSDGSPNTGQGNVNDSNVPNYGNNTQGTRSDGNESYSSNYTSNNSLSNTGHNNRVNSNKNGVSHSNNSSNSQVSINNPTSMNQNLSPPVNSQSIYSSLIQQTCSINPKLKEAMRKKRDKAEVDAEIKRRLAEIDELEKLARSQHANVLEKIGARTRSRMLTSSQSANIDEEDVVSISSDDSQCTSISTNEAANSSSKVAEISKSEDVNEEPTTTQEDEMKTSQISTLGEGTKEDISPLGLFLKGSVSILPIDTSRRTKKKKINDVEPENVLKVGNKIQGQNKNDLIDVSKLCVKKSSIAVQNKKNNLNNETPIIDLPTHIANNVTLEIYNKPLDAGEQRSLTQKEPNASVSISEHIKNKRDVISVYQFRESDESEPDEEVYPKQKYNCMSKKRTEVGKQRNKINPSSLSLKKTQQLQRKPIRKTRLGSVVHESFSEKCSSSSRESSPFNQITRKPCEMAQELQNQTELSLSTNSVPEPDSSTSVNDISCTNPGSVDISKDSVVRSSTQADETNSVVSSINTSQESDMTPSSPITGFKQPYRKSLVNRRRKKRRSYFGRCLMPTNNLESSLNESFGDNNDQTNTHSEEVVSSSVNTIQIPQDKKKRRRRKTVMDLLMEDSMLSVTRDFPMSPNPYMFSSFYKDIDLSNSNTKSNAPNESTSTEQNSKKINEDRGLPLKPDFLAQKLRILEKLKNISRKNRKTRQCRTLVCYNEDSLPESLVESPVSESVPNNGDGGVTSQETSAKIINENNAESADKPIEDPAALPKVNIKSTDKESGSIVSTFETLRKVENSSLSKPSLQKGRKSKVNKNLKNLNNDDEWETQSETTTDVHNKEKIPNENFSSSSLLGTRANSPNFENNQNSNNVELSEFDKLLESKPKDSTRIKLSYDYDPGSPQSPSEDKSDDAPDDFFYSLPSPRQTSDDDSSASENSNDNDYLSSKCTTIQNKCTANASSTLVSIEKKLMRPEKIVCSILKTKIGKMLPYFGDTTTDDDIDEDIPLSIKLSQFTGQNKKEEDLQPICAKEENPSNSEALNKLPLKTLKHPTFKGRRQQLRKKVPLSKLRKSERSTRNSSANLDGGQLVANATLGDISINKIDLLDESSNLNSNSVQLRKSSRKLKTTNVLCKETVCDLKPTSVEESLDKQENERNNDSNLSNETHLDPQNEPAPLKRKGRPPKTKLLKENNTDKDTKRQNDQSTAEAENVVEDGSFSNNESLQFTKRKEKCSGLEDDENHIKLTDHSTAVGIKDDGECSTSTINQNSQETPKLQLSDLDSAIQKSITLRRTRAKTVKGSLEFERNVDEAPIMRKRSENNLNDHPKEDLLEDLPLNKRTVTETTPRRRRKENSPIENTGRNVAIDNSVTNVDDALEIVEDSYPNNNEERDNSVDKCFSDSPPPLIRTRARRAKLITLENNDLDPPSLETSIPPNIGNEKEELESSENTGSNLVSTDAFSHEDISLPPRKRGRKPKNVSGSINPKSNVSEKLFKTPNNILPKLPNNSKIQESEESLLIKSNSLETECWPRKRGRRGKQKIIRRKTDQRLNVSNKVTDSDDDSEIEINIPKISLNEELVFENSQPEELENNISNIREDEGDLSDDCSENPDFVMREDGRKRKRKARENKEEINVSDPTPSIVSNAVSKSNTENDDTRTKKRKTQNNDENEGNESRYETSRSGSSFQPAYKSQDCANQPFLWNKISAFLNKSTRSVGTQVKVKNMALKGFETSEPEVSLQSELTLPQVIKTLFEELRFIDSSFSNS